MRVGGIGCDVIKGVRKGKLAEHWDGCAVGTRAICNRDERDGDGVLLLPRCGVTVAPLLSARFHLWGMEGLVRKRWDDGSFSKQKEKKKSHLPLDRVQWPSWRTGVMMGVGGDGPVVKARGVTFHVLEGR